MGALAVPIAIGAAVGGGSQLLRGKGIGGALQGAALGGVGGGLTGGLSSALSGTAAAAASAAPETASLAALPAADTSAAGIGAGFGYGTDAGLGAIDAATPTAADIGAGFGSSIGTSPSSGLDVLSLMKKYGTVDNLAGAAKMYEAMPKNKQGVPPQSSASIIKASQLQEAPLAGLLNASNNMTDYKKPYFTLLG
jgi:hypothetical protein